jgi:hypothetical protein
MTYARFSDIFEAVAYCKSPNNEVPVTGSWRMMDKLFADFNAARRDRFTAGLILVLDEIMSAWRPQTTSTGGLPNVSFIPRKPENLGTEFKTVCCGITGVMLFVEVQKGKCAMKEADFASEFGVNAAISLRMAHGAARRTRVEGGLAESQASLTYTSQPLMGHSQPGVFPGSVSPPPPGPVAVPRVSGHVAFGDSFFASSAVANGMMRGVAAKDDSSGFSMSFGGPVKLSRKDYPKKYVEELMEDFPSGTWVVLKAQYKGQPGPENELVAVGYKYCLKKVLCFVFTGDFSTRGGDPYVARFRDEHGNLATRNIARPACVSQYFKFSPKVDNHNQLRQYELALEKTWVPKSQQKGACWRRIWTTFVGITVVDMFRICNQFLEPNHPSGVAGLTVKGFTDALARALVTNKEADTRGLVVSAPSRASGAKRTASGTARNAAGERVLRFEQNKLFSGRLQSGTRRQHNCAACWRVFRRESRTTWVCMGITELQNTPVCHPKTGRVCFAYLKRKGAQPKVRMDDDEVRAEKRVFDELNEVIIV